MKKKEKDFQIDGQLSIFDMLKIPSDIDKTYSPSEINAVVLQLLDAQKRAEKREREEKKIRDPSNTRGLVPAFAARLLKELKKPQTDWRTILNSFVQEEIADYSFVPPDRRMDDGDFFLPNFNEKEDIVSDILFMIDTSASMSDDMVTAAYSEVKGAIDQFDGKLNGWLGFFDAAIVEPRPFS